MNECNQWVFAGFEIDLRTGVLRKNGASVRIGPQAFRALALLVSRGGDVVTREELQKEIWGDRHVDFEHGLNVCIRQVRTALGDGADGDPIIVTCPREGYRLGVPAERVADVRTPHLRWSHLRRWSAAAAALVLVAAGSLVVLLMTGTPVPSLDPVSFAAAWPTKSSDAHAWYWRGREYYDRSTGRRPAWALPYFETAATLDPNFTLAHASLAVSYLDKAATGVAPVESTRKARESAQRALALGPQYAETHVALAELGYRLDSDVRTAEREFVRAMELDGRNAYARTRYAVFLHEQRRFDQALEQLRVAQELDPLSIMSSWQIANVQFYSGKFEAALTQAKRTLELDPNHSWSYRTVGQCLEEMGRHDEAIAAYLKAGQVALGHLGRAYAVTGRRAEAESVLTALTRRPVDETGHNGVAIAFILTGLGDHAQAIAWLEKTHRDGVRLPFSLRVAPQWKALRDSRSFDSFLKKNEVAGS
jgi:DNA-binding winged helix-turn-helix (wHTH) protein/tetratricopeptide (TPR) repeat protein